MTSIIDETIIFVLVKLYIYHAHKDDKLLLRTKTSE